MKGRPVRNPIQQLIQRWRYGEPVVVVSGVPRSGTSMLMNMLQRGGLAVMSDTTRPADEDNPRGYFELERVKHLEREADKSWVREARGKALKVVSHLLKELPEDNVYRILLMDRDLDEVIASQNRMLQRRGEPNPVNDEKAIELYRRHLVNVRILARQRPNLELLEVRHRDVLTDPLGCATRINRFLGGRLDPEKMAGIVDPGLYRNRRARTQIAPHTGL